MMQKDAVVNFCGRISSRGVFEVPATLTARLHEEHLGCQLLVGGYIAGRDDLRRRFGLEQRRPTDSELLAHAFRAWGSDLQAHVLGEYAAVVYDSTAKICLLTHDALGLTPLFYSVQTGGVAFSTRIADLVDASSARNLDEEFIADFLIRGSTTTERTPYSSIKRVMPGRSLWWSNGQLKERQTWNLDDVPTARYKDDAEYEERFRALVAAGIEATLDTEGPTWVALSGGLDSSTVACVAGARRLDAYSVISPRWPKSDEQRWMRAVIEQYDLPWHPVDVETVLPFSSLPGEFVGEPTECVIDQEMLRVQNQLLSSHGSKVMLTGAGGDIVFGASRGEIPIHLADLLFNGKPMSAVRAMSSWRQGSESSRSYSYWVLKSLLQPAANHFLGRRNRGAERHALPPWIEPEYAREKHLAHREKTVWGPICRTPSRQVISDSLYGLMAAMQPPGPMTFALRHPLLYRPLVEFMWSIPWDQKLRPRCDRYLQRRALKGVLPELVRRRAGSVTGSAALVEGLRRSRDWFDYLCDRPMLAEHGIADARKWRNAVRKASVGQTHGDKFFIASVALEVWLKQLSELRTLLKP